jgi:hypothetical protein
VHPVLSERRALVAYLAIWLALSYLPASVLASPGDGRFLLALAVAAPPTLLAGLAALPLFYVCHALPPRPGGMGGTLRVHATLGLVWTAAWWGMLDLAARLPDLGGAVDLVGEVERRWGALAAQGALLYLGIVAFYTGASSARRARASEWRAAAASLRAQEAQLALLRAQIHPHFLFNSLNAISALTVEDPHLARELCILLADFLRGSLALGERGMVSLAEEIGLARAYLDIERIRLGNRLAVDIQVSPSASEVQLPALLLQPLVENAITHGVATCARGGTLSLDARTTPGTLVVTLTNPFDPQAPPRRGRGGASGIGLANVSRRLSASYQGASLSTRRDADRFTSTLVLPIGGREAPYGWDARASAQGPDRR